ncbi:EAL domain-containing protein [Rhodoferax sp. 4810]|nr:EAL domain-containing protein [Rhodoferax jenense]
MLPVNVSSFKKSSGLLLLALAAPLLWWAPNASRQWVITPQVYLPLHTAAEIFAVVVGMLIFVTGYHAVLSARKRAVVLLGVCFLGVGLLDFLHALSFPGMPDVLSINSPHKALAFWLAARLLAAGALLVYVLLPHGPDATLVQKRLALALMLAVVGVAGSIGLVWPDRLPVLFEPGQGLTPLKIGLEWLVVGLGLGSLGVLWYRRVILAQACVAALAFAVGLSAISELFFMTQGEAIADVSSAIGHVYKMAAYLFLFYATFNESLRRPLQRIRVQSQREKLILNAAPDGILWVDSRGDMLMANPAMEALTGYDSAALVGKNINILLPEHLRLRHGISMAAHFNAPEPRAMGKLDMHLLRRDGELLPVDISLGHWEDEGQRHAIAYIRDLTERKKFEAALQFKATHDELSGLPNRWFFNLQLDQALARSARSGTRVALLLLDLDNFKTVNDTFGHATGDALLVQAGARMRAVLRDTDTLARLGGDEFAILLTDLAPDHQTERVVIKLLTALCVTYRLQALEVSSSASLGVAFCPDDAKDSTTLLRYADLAMYRAKEGGRGTFAFFSQGMDSRLLEDMQMYNRLKEAITLGDLALHYQPQVDVQSGAIVGAEALLRWTDPVLGQVPPAKFVAVAEATGLILALSDWVLETACKQIAAWQDDGTPLHVAINVSAQQFQQLDLPDKVSATLKRTGAQAQWLAIEITETVAMKRPEQARDQLDALVALGCRVALDDFGTGYSSLAYLKALPVHKLKIDKSFMDGIPDDPSDAAISCAIIAMAHSLGMAVIAEGVETVAQLAFLNQYGCETYQGWLFAKAMPADEMTRLILQNRELLAQE